MANGKFAGGDGSELTPYLIEDGYDLSAIRNNLSANYKLIKSVDLTTICNESDGTGWAPIDVFRGNFDGNGFMIRNLFINRVGDNQALFSSLRGGRLSNFGMTGVNVTGGTTGTAAVVGRMSTNDDMVSNIFVEGVITAGNNMASLVATVDAGNILNCYSEANLVGTSGAVYAGGLVNVLNNKNSTVKNCFYGGTMTGQSARVGCVNQIKSGTVTDCFYDSTKNPLNPATAGATAKADLESPATFANWDDQYFNFKKKTWVLRQGSYPRLFFTEATKYFIFTNNVYKTFEKQAWVDVSTSFPTQAMFDEHGISDNTLSVISRFKWNELKQFGSFDVVASTDKYVVDRTVVKQDMVVDTQLSDCVILKTTLDFSKLGDSINAIKIVQ